MNKNSMYSTALKHLLIAGIMLLITLPTFAYVTIASSSHTIKIGEVLHLSVPDATQGYIDHAVWACSNPHISFIMKNDIEAQIQVTQAFSGTAIVELVFVEKYLDSSNKTRAITYYKEFKINCSSEGNINLTSISFPIIEVKIGDIVEIIPTVKPVNATVTYSSIIPNNASTTIANIFLFNNKVKARALTPGTATATITTSNGKSAKITVTVEHPQVGSGITDNKGNSIYDTTLLKAVARMESLFTKTLQHKK